MPKHRNLSPEEFWVPLGVAAAIILALILAGMVSGCGGRVEEPLELECCQTGSSYNYSRNEYAGTFECNREPLRDELGLDCDEPQGNTIKCRF